MRRLWILGFLSGLVGPTPSLAQTEDPRNPNWAKYHSTAEVYGILREWARLYPQLTELYSIGETLKGTPLLVLEVTNERTGPAAEKPGYYYDGNIHAGELTGAEVTLYLAWYLLTNYGRDPRVTRLLDTRAVYLRPKFNPDGADLALNPAVQLRSTPRPYDEDFDGLQDEDPPEDLDGDGRFNEDGVGGIDMNRNFPREWGLEFEQEGAGPYPLSEPETRATIEFLHNYRNITGIFHGHTSGGFLYRLPSTGPWEAFNLFDQNLILELAEKYRATTGQPVVPSYSDPRVHRHGTLISWGYWDYGVIGFVPEFWGGFGKDYDGDGRVSEVEQLRWNDEELGGRGFAPWKPFDHPQLGKVEIGGWRTRYTRQNPPPHLLRGEIAKYLPWMLWLAEISPRVVIREVEVTPLAGAGLFRLRVTVENEGYLSTNLTQRALDARLAPPVRALLEVRDGELMSGRARTDLGHLKGTRDASGDERASASRATADYVIRATGPRPVAVVTVVSEKGGTARRELPLRR